MFILIDHKMPQEAKCKLALYGELIEFATEGITYEAISGHPDIFFCNTPSGLIVAQNLPKEYFSTLDKKGIPYSVGQIPVGNKYPATVLYNTLVTNNYIIQNSAISDSSIQTLNPNLNIISVKQGYVRCSLLALPNNTYITSDHSIEKALKCLDLDVLFVDPSCIKLDGFDHGFFGGVCGLYENTLFICGRLKHFKENKLIAEFVGNAGVRIVELFDGKPQDIGTIMFIDP